jgi:hypothetical protein
MQFSRAVAYACFTVMMWLMAVTGVLFVALTLAQYLRGERGANPAMTLASAAGCLILALLLHHLARRIAQST